MIHILIACLLRLYHIEYLYPQPFTYTFSTFSSAVLYCPRCILFPLKCSYPISKLMRCTILPAFATSMMSFDLQRYSSLSWRISYGISTKLWLLLLSYIGILLKCFVIAHNKYSYIIIKTIIDHNACSFVYAVFDFIVALTCYCLLATLLP